ncbi:MAG TPA: sigma factor-like helix-turn-helix DNA-binding protein [Urbifossiella sp.]|nr:sigma factor-like helix-turn-helix DNA-binding protein [Urbifossiella sp.]
MRNRRRRVEAATAPPAGFRPVDPTGQAELAAWLDAELANLPSHYRVPVVLCELQGRSRKDAARELGVPEGTLSSRLAKARKLLGERLVRKGAPAVVLASLLAPEATAVPPALIDRTVHLLVGTAAGTVPAAIDHVARGVVTAMLVTRLRGLTVAVGVVLLGAGGLTIALAGTGQTEGRPQAAVAAESNVAAPLPQPAEPAWMKAFNAAYQLKEGEYVKRVPPPFVPERRDFVRVRFPGADDKSVAGLLTMGVLFAEADGKIVSYRAVVTTDAIDFARPAIQVRPKRLPLRSVIAYSTGRIGPEVVFDDRAKDRDVFMEGDFVIRKGAPLEKLLPGLQKAIGECEMDVPKAHPVFSLKEEEQDVFVVSGKFKITPRKWRGAGEVDVYADEAVLNKEGFGEFGGTVTTSVHSDPPRLFVRELGAFLNRRMVWEAEDTAGVPFRAYTHYRSEDRANAAQFAADRDPEKVLWNVSEQTGLVFRTERRKVQVLNVVIPQR